MNKELLDVINNGALAILPTDTVYGIIADATNESAASLVFEAKKREKKPLIVMVSSIDMLNKYAEVNELQSKLIEKYWPNTLTILFKKKDTISNTVTADSSYVGIRMPNNKLLLELMNTLDKPLISTSANISNEKVITSVDLIDIELKKYISYIYDGGQMSDVASTLVKAEDNKITFLREGILSEKIKEDFKDNL